MTNSERSPLLNGWRKLERLAPIAGLSLVVAVAILAPQAPQGGEETERRHARIRLAFESVPLRLGDWIGEDQPLPPAAVEMLRPNAVLSRDYRRLGDPARISVSIIHCGDVRDMGSHYPPICYPAHGWSLRNESASDRAGLPEAWSTDTAGARGPVGMQGSLTLGGDRLPCRIYRFSRMLDSLTEARMTVVNVFILPSGEWRSDLESIREASERRRLAAEGVAQIQLVMSGWPDAAAAMELAEEFLAELPPRIFLSMGWQPPDADGPMKPRDE
jgi:hypothetical protein